MDSIRKYIREVPDFPKPGILFRDITPLLGNARAFSTVADTLAFRFRELGVQTVVGIESRGFLFGIPVAERLHIGFAPVRKLGKLPWKSRKATYQLEYGTDTLEMHEDAIQPGHRVLCVDDLLATGGTMSACVRLVEESGGIVVGCAFVIELAALKGRDKLAGHDVYSVITYE